MFPVKKFNFLIRTHHITSNTKQRLHASLFYSNNLEKILIANRGEIACRISRTAKKLGIKTVTVYSDADKNSMHVDLADEAYHIGAAPSNHSYLNQNKIILVAKKSKCQAIHPGYGFLSENTEFAEMCQKERIVFIGPPAGAIRDMGIKNTSKEIMIKAGVPVIEGYHGEDQSNKTLLLEAKRIGFPIMIKAIRGGGGKGMRIALEEKEFFEALESARTESEKAFGDSGILLEKYITKPRHIEVQIFADKHGNVVHLFERDCSVQRRHQKVIEEAPAPGISKELRSKLGNTAVNAAKAVGYVGAGTVEFIMDSNNYDNFYFMEMNTRLQVEHPITEEITGLDLVEWQLKVAMGEKLPLQQEDIHHQGHAFEARIYAENPRNHFLPGAGPLLYLKTPRGVGNVRVETGVRENDEVSVYYDPMIAKLVTRGKSRNEALNILRAKLAEYNIAGIDTNVEFLKDLCAHPKFQQAQVHTGFINENYKELFPLLQVPDEIMIQGTLGLILYEEMEKLESSMKTQNPFNPFVVETGRRINHILTKTFHLDLSNEIVPVKVQYIEMEVYLMKVGNAGPWRRVTGIMKKQNCELQMSTEIDGVYSKAKLVKIKDNLYIFTVNRAWKIKISPSKFVSSIEHKLNTDGSTVVSPMPGLVDKILVKKGDNVKKGDSLVVIVAMKMEHVIRASADGIIKDVCCSTNSNVQKNQLLVKLSLDKVQ